MISLSTRIILLFLAFHVIVEAVAACIMLKNRDKLNDRARKYITVFFIASSVSSLVEIIMVISTPLEPNAYRYKSDLMWISYFCLIDVLLCGAVAPTMVECKAGILYYAAMAIVGGVPDNKRSV